MMSFLFIYLFIYLFIVFNSFQAYFFNKKDNLLNDQRVRVNDTSYGSQPCQYFLSPF